MAQRRFSYPAASPSGAPVNGGLIRVKMVLLGSSGVGKSSLALRFNKDEFKPSSPTVGCAYLTQVVYLPSATIRFEIWDTAGQEKFHSVTPLYYRGAHAALVVYDISSKESFVRAQLWLKELEKQYIPGETVVGLVGNKADLSSSRQVSLQGWPQTRRKQRFVVHGNIRQIWRTGAGTADDHCPQGERELLRGSRPHRMARGRERGRAEWTQALPSQCLLLSQGPIPGLKEDNGGNRPGLAQHSHNVHKDRH
ncbi:hypothetical protein GJAV_G00205930 [Gymnothorax javanicus]|nr:hypothetical protein GJAV_G00205930 [Gymnothorax javanicus]